MADIYHGGSVWLPGIDDITKFVQLNRQSSYDFEEAGFGGTANVFRGIYYQKDGQTMHVAVKCIHPSEFEGREDEYKKKTKKKLARELEIWRALSGNVNIIELLGMTTHPGPLPSAVSPFCQWDLKAYLQRTSPPPKHVQMMTDTLQGLKYMHELKPSPIAHGDLKSHNILVTADEKALLCDFGRARLPSDQPRELSNSSPFGATPRYMSPELCVTTVTGPTPASDMWAYGCVALEILCRIQPYEDIADDFEVMQLIRQGNAPSKRPRGIRGALLNDTLWSTLASCWLEQGWRPSSRMFLEALNRMLQTGEVPTSPISLNLFTTSMDEPALAKWPDDMQDLRAQITIQDETCLLSSSTRSKVWRATLGSRWRDSTRKVVVVKAPRLNVHPGDRESYDHLQTIFRRRVTDRFGIRHRNIVKILGLDSSQSGHPGFVLEYCEKGSLISFCRVYDPDGWRFSHECARPKRPQANAYSMIWDILEGLKYMHSYGPVPVPQGDLTPDNILVSADGTAKISLFSFGRVIAAIPTAATLTASVGPLIPFRWMSPELLLSTSKPTAESDMWSLGCIGFWLLTGLRPYAGHLRDDFAGLENVSGIPPANITQIDFASGLGDHGRSADRDAPWITNGLWSTITRCWTVDPLLRPSARRFLDVLKGLEGRKHDWLPLDVADLAGKIAYVDPAENRNGPGKTRIARYITAWMHHRPGRGEAIKYYQVDMLLLRTTYNPNWYSKPMQVAIKHEFKYRAQDKLQDTRPFIPSIRHEITISAQLDHPNICKLIGIDTSHEDIPMMVFEYISDTTLEMRLKSELSFEDKVWLLNDITSAIVYLHEHTNGSIAYGNFSPANIYITSGGQAKLTNFTCAFQYATQPTQIPAPLSSIASGTRGGVSRWRSPEYNRECIPEEHVPLPTAPSDIWSLGCIILNMFVREHPFFKVPHQESIDQILAGVYPCEAPECASLDPRLLSLVRSMQSQDPAARPLAKDVSKVVSRLI